MTYLTRAAKLAQCRTFLDRPPPEPTAPETVEQFLWRVAGIDLHRCPQCHSGRLHLVALAPPLPPATGPPAIP